MMSDTQTAESSTILSEPATEKARLDVLDVLRGLAILGIFFMNIPWMANSNWLAMENPKWIGWSDADKWTWSGLEIFFSGTQRGVLELLFGAALMLLTAKAMTPDGPVSAADNYIRRNLWLLLFGIAHIFLFLWPGDILHAYALTALFLFPFRLLKPKWLLVIGLSFAVLQVGGGATEYVSRTKLVAEVEQIAVKEKAGTPLTKDEKETKKAWQEKLDKLTISKETQKKVAQEKKEHEGGFGAYAGGQIGLWTALMGKGMLPFTMLEAFTTMLIGIALYKWGIIQGERSKGFYLKLLLVTYGFGLTARAVGVYEVLQFYPNPKTIWMTNELARLAVSVGHVALVNWAMQTAGGQRLLAPLKAAGRTAFTLYIMQTIIGVWILFAPFGFDLWGRYSWANMTLIALAVIVGQVIIANLWLRRFRMGPLEWAWRSLSLWQRQPFRR